MSLCHVQCARFYTHDRKWSCIGRHWNKLWRRNKLCRSAGRVKVSWTGQISRAWWHLPLFTWQVCQTARPLLILFRKTLMEGIIPRDWKQAKVTPIFKNGSRRNPSNFRPISLTSHPCEILERIIRKHVHWTHREMEPTNPSPAWIYAWMDLQTLHQHGQLPYWCFSLSDVTIAAGSHIWKDKPLVRTSHSQDVTERHCDVTQCIVHCETLRVLTSNGYLFQWNQVSKCMNEEIWEWRTCY